MKLLSLGGGHGDLNMVISEQKDVKNSAKAFMAAQNSGKMDRLNWSSFLKRCSTPADFRKTAG